MKSNNRPSLNKKTKILEKVLASIKSKFNEAKKSSNEDSKTKEDERILANLPDFIEESLKELAVDDLSRSDAGSTTDLSFVESVDALDEGHLPAIYNPEKQQAYNLEKERERLEGESLTDWLKRVVLSHYNSLPYPLNKGQNDGSNEDADAMPSSPLMSLSM